MAPLDLDGMLRRLHLPTVRRLYPELETRTETEGLSHRDFLALLIAEEVAHRAQTRIERSVRKARFPFLRTIEDFDFTFQISVRLQLLGSYLGPELVSEGRSLILCGPTGTGKTHLGIAIAYRAIQNGYEALFTGAAEMIETLSVATRRGELAATLARYTHPPVLVIDEVGYLTVGGDAANLMFQVVNERYLHHRPMLFTTNKPLAAWGLVLHDPDLAEAILDRVLERGRLVELRGASYRTRHLKRAESDRSPLHEGAIISGNQGPKFPEPTAYAATAPMDTRSARRASGDSGGSAVNSGNAAPAHEVTILLKRLRDGDTRALDQLMPVIHGELRRIARAHLRHERPWHTLQATELAHEAYLRLAGVGQHDWRDRAHFFAVASGIMRRILIDHARKRTAARRGGNARHVPLDEAAMLGGGQPEELVALDDALLRLGALDARQERIVELRFFGGLDVEETAAVLGVSARTVKREWSVARAWLRAELGR